MKASGINIKKVDTHPDRPWMVTVAPSVFGKQIRKRFLTKKEADLQAHSYAMKVQIDELKKALPEGDIQHNATK